MSGLLAGVFATIAMIPAMVGTIESAEHKLTLVLCNGGTLTIEIAGQQAPAPGTQPCCVSKGCRSGEKRKRIDRVQ